MLKQNFCKWLKSAHAWSNSVLEPLNDTLAHTNHNFFDHDWKLPHFTFLKIFCSMYGNHSYSQTIPMLMLPVLSNPLTKWAFSVTPNGSCIRIKGRRGEFKWRWERAEVWQNRWKPLLLNTSYTCNDHSTWKTQCTTHTHTHTHTPLMYCLVVTSNSWKITNRGHVCSRAEEGRRCTTPSQSGL